MYMVLPRPPSRHAVNPILSHYGIQVRGRSRRLTRNYRTTRQNLALAFGLLDPGRYEDLEGQEEDHRYVPPRSGPEPQPLYVAATRACDQLAISWSGQASPLLEGISKAE
nr:hypothetical protein [Actinomyces sp. 2119]